MRRALLGLAVALLAAAALYLFAIRDSVVAPRVSVPAVTATLGAEGEAIAVTADGVVLPWYPLPAEPRLPRLPLDEPPRGDRLAGPALQQARVLGAAPAALRPYLAASRYGESGVDVETTAGIELRFGDASDAARKWRAAAAVLADPGVSSLDYVDLHAPAHPSFGGSGHALPPVP